MDKIIKVNFEEWQKKADDESLKQWNQGQKLEISGLNISDEIVEVHFSLQEVSGTAKRMLGVVKDGIIHTSIPAFILEGPEHCFETMRNYGAWAWVYVSDEESAETIRKIEFIIEARPKPDEYVTPEELSFLQQLEEAIKNKITTPSSAKVGQLLRVKEVDENGKPIAFDAIDVSGASDEQIQEAVDSYLDENPIEVEVPTKTSQLENDSGFAYQQLLDMQLESLEELLWGLDGSLLRVSEVANEANTVAKGASKPLVYKNYEIMVNYINSYMNDDIEGLRIGWNVLIITLNVPDLWVSGISQEYVWYEYVSDEQLVADLQNGQVQVGYYLLSPLETQKVNLTEYPTQEDLDDVYTNLREEDFALGVQIENLENHVNDMFAEYVTEVAELLDENLALLGGGVNE